MKNNFFSFRRGEKILLMIFIAVFFLCSITLFFLFTEKHSKSIPTSGGVFKEGVILPQNQNIILNPVFVYGKRENGVEADITNLLFSGLMKFNSQTGEIEDYIAEKHDLSFDKRTYTFYLKKGMLWHDGENVTARDVVFTYQNIVKNPKFPNQILRDAFKDVQIQMIDEYTVSFTIPKAYKFFLTNFTVGILPRHILESVNVEDLEFDDFSHTPVGNGPFKIKEWVEVNPGVKKLVLESFQGSSLTNPYFDSFEFYFYPSQNTLSFDSERLNAIRPFYQGEEDKYFLSDKFEPYDFTLPQYSALFFNLDKEVFKGKNGLKLRTGLRLGVDKEYILENLVYGKRVDTPLLQEQGKEWLYEYAPEKAQGSIKDAGWFLPWKIPKTKEIPESKSDFLSLPTSEGTFVTEQEKITLGGKFPSLSRSYKIFLNEKEVFSKSITKEEASKEWKYEINEIPTGRHAIKIKFYDRWKKQQGEDALSLYRDAEDLPEYAKGNQEQNTQTENIEDSTTDQVEGEENLPVIEEEESNAEQPENNQENQLIETKTPEEKISNTEKDITRRNLSGEKLRLTLVTQKNPPYYGDIAYFLQEQWEDFGVELEVKVLEPQEFLKTVAYREYDILLFGQNLGYNFDIYDFFHESQINRGNLSQYKSPRASVLIEEIRQSHLEEVRAKKLVDLQNILKEDVPAVFLFTPSYRYYIDEEVGNINFFSKDQDGEEKKFPIIMLRDRISNADKWYIQKEKKLVDQVSLLDFPSWIKEEYKKLFFLEK